MLYDKYVGVPETGSIIEYLFVLIRMRRDYMELLKTYTLAQAIRDDETGKATQEAFENFKSAVLPHLKNQQKRAVIDVAEAMRREFARGPLKVKALTPSNMVKSRLGTVVNSIRQPPFKWRGK